MGDDVLDFDWDEGNRGHVALHGVETIEVEQAILDPEAIFVEIQSEFEEERTKVVGMTASGRILEVVLIFRGEAIRVVTAYDAPSRLKTRYLERRTG